MSAADLQPGRDVEADAQSALAASEDRRVDGEHERAVAVRARLVDQRLCDARVAEDVHLEPARRAGRGLRHRGGTHRRGAREHHDRPRRSGCARGRRLPVRMEELLRGHRRDDDRSSDRRAEDRRARVDAVSADEDPRAELPPRERRDIVAECRLVSGAAADVLPGVVVEALAREQLVVVDVERVAHANNSVSLSRSTSSSSDAQTGTRCAGRRGPTTTAADVGVREDPRERQRRRIAEPRELLERVEDLVAHEPAYGSGRSVIREPSANGVSRVYLPVSQPPASGLNASNSIPCSTHSGITSRSDVAHEQRVLVLDDRDRRELDRLGEVGGVDVRDADRSDHAVAHELLERRRASRRAASRDRARGRGRRRCARRRGARRSRARHAGSAPGARPPSSPLVHRMEHLARQREPCGPPRRDPRADRPLAAPAAVRRRGVEPADAALPRRVHHLERLAPRSRPYRRARDRSRRRRSCRRRGRSARCPSEDHAAVREHASHADRLVHADRRRVLRADEQADASARARAAAGRDRACRAARNRVRGPPDRPTPAGSAPPTASTPRPPP